MSSSVEDNETPLLTRLLRFWINRGVRALLIVVVVLAAGFMSGLPQATLMQPQSAEQPQALNPLPVVPLSANLRHSRMTGAAMTSHNLTAAHFVSHLPADKLSAETQQTREQG